MDYNIENRERLEKIQCKDCWKKGKVSFCLYCPFFEKNKKDNEAKNREEQMKDLERHIFKLEKKVRTNDLCGYSNWETKKLLNSLLNEYLFFKANEIKDETFEKLEKEELQRKIEIMALLSKKSTKADVDAYFEPLNGYDSKRVIYELLDIIRSQPHDERDIFMKLKEYWLTQKKDVNPEGLKKYKYDNEGGA